MCELASTDHPFFSFELPFHLSSSSLSRLIAVFRASDPSAPLISSTRLPFFLRPSAIRTRQRGNTRAIYPVFENASENRTCRVNGNSFVIPVEYRTRVALTIRNDEEKKVGAIKRYEWNLWHDRSSNGIPSCEPHFPERCDKSHDRGHVYAATFVRDSEIRYTGSIYKN